MFMGPKAQPFHLVEESPWPIYVGYLSMIMGISLVKWFHTGSPSFFIFTEMSLTLLATQWWRDVTRESTQQGHHTKQVCLGIRQGMILFISSEVLFFFAFFWTFFHTSLSPAIELGSTWPPAGTNPFNPFEIPLLNTLILLSSGMSVTWAHHSMLSGQYRQANQALFSTVFLGVYFTALQALEYNEASFSMADSAFGSSFFLATGFHGLHVIIGSTFLISCLGRNYSNQMSEAHHLGFEAAAWYWHFVDVVWLFLFTALYWWGGK